MGALNNDYFLEELNENNRFTTVGILSAHSQIHSHSFEAKRSKLYWSRNQQILFGHSVY